MSKARLNGLYLLMLGSLIFVLMGAALVYTSSFDAGDFKASYYSARCLLQHCDPYNKSEVLRIYSAEGGASARQLATRHVYLPSTFAFTVPIAMLPWGVAHLLWVSLSAGGLIVASFLMWDLGADYAPILSGALIGFLLANSVVLVMLGNPSGIAISLCVIAAWCFVRNRFMAAGIICFAFSVAVKPQDAVFIWFYFLLTGGVYRKRAMQTLLAAAVLSLPMVLWVWRVSPNWMRELHSNMLELFVPGSIDYPGPAALGTRGLVNLQVAISIFEGDSRIYNSVSYSLCSLIMIALAIFTFRSRANPMRACFALATIAPLSLLPVYHHFYDTKLLLLTVPACAILWNEGGLIGWLALLLNTLGIVMTADFPAAILFGPSGSPNLPLTGLSGKILTVTLMWPVPLILLIVCVFYLWVYARRTLGREIPTELGRTNREPVGAESLECGSHTLELLGNASATSLRAVCDRKKG